MVVTWVIVYFLLVDVRLIASASANDCMESLLSERTYYASSGTLTSTH